MSLQNDEAPFQGPFRLGFRRSARRRGTPGGVVSRMTRIGRALRNSASMISGLVQFRGPHRVNRCSRCESSLVNRRTSLGAGPSMAGTTVSRRATSSATHRRPFGSVYRAANARRLVWSMGYLVRTPYGKSKDWSRSCLRANRRLIRDAWRAASIVPLTAPDDRQILPRIALGEAQLRFDDVADERREPVVV